MSISRLTWSVVVSVWALAACQLQPSSSLARTEVPIFIPPALPETIQTADTAPLPFEIVQSETEYLNPLEGFAFKPITVWSDDQPALTLQTIQDQVTLSTGDDSLFFTISSQQTSEPLSSVDCLEGTRKSMAESSTFFQVTALDEMQLPAGPAAAFQFRDIVDSDTAIYGQVLVLTSQNRCLHLIGISLTAQPEQSWQASGQPVFLKLAASLRVLEGQEILDCQISADLSYGFSPDDPIRVGSNQLSDGPQREQLYLLTLRGPNGEEVIFNRQAPQFNQAGVVVDPYLIEYEGLATPVTLYFDLYSYAPLQAPFGFTCEAPFPIPPPQE